VAAANEYGQRRQAVGQGLGARKLDAMLADLDRALDADFLREVDEALERIARGGALAQVWVEPLAAG